LVGGGEVFIQYVEEKRKGDIEEGGIGTKCKCQRYGVLVAIHSSLKKWGGGGCSLPVSLLHRVSLDVTSFVFLAS
jgi:hypothetical protein